MKVAYLINQYPKVSHSFIRREILALERLGVNVVRFAVRGWDADLVDSEDKSELFKTNYLLRGGLLPLLWSFIRLLLSQPVTTWRAMKIVFRFSRRADRSLIYHVAYLLEASYLTRLLKVNQCRHLHAHFGTNSAELALLAATLSHCTYSFTVHGPEEFDKPEFIRLREKIESARFVVAISSFGKSQLYRWTSSAHWNKIHTVHCGLDASFLAVEPSSVPDVARLVCVGRLCEQKGQLLLIQAVHLLKQQKISFELVLAGDGEMRAEIEAEIERLGLQDQVHISGWISNTQVRDTILSSRAMVLPSFAEGLPVVIMEAMALCRPVITTYIAGVPELVKQDVNGWLFPAGDIEALAGAMRACLETSAISLQLMGERARSLVQERHSVDSEAQKLHKLFELGSDSAAP